MAASILVVIMAAARGVPPRTAVVEITFSDRADLQRIRATGATISRVRSDRAEIYVPASRIEALDALELPYRITEWQPAALPKGRENYHDYPEVTAALAAFTEGYPEITNLVSLGQSEGGRELWALHISDNPTDEEDEPEFKYLATLHGDEPIGTELCLDFIGLLLSEYGSNPRITGLVDETSIWVVPLANPDGRMLGQRYNLDGQDLNRSFPVYPEDYSGTFFGGDALSDAGRPVEVGHIMRWTAENSFVLSANFHTGATVVNYPFDNEPGIPSGQDAPTADDALMESLSLRYAMNNPVMWNSPFFTDGIVNGSAWYSILGGMQDWNYRYVGCIDMTIELSDTKWPDDTALPGLWADNEEAMLSYLEGVHLGVRGLVTDKKTGLPVWAQVRVRGNTQRVFTDPEVGDYHRLLLPGMYDMEFFAPGYIPYLVRGVTVEEGGAVRRDVTLSDGDLNGDGWVEAVDIQMAIAAVLRQPGAVDADVDGGGATVTDVQHIINIALGKSPEPRPSGW